MRGSGYLLSGSLVAQLCSVAQALLLARYLGVRQYGVLGLIMAYPTLVNQFLDGRSWETVVKFVTAFQAASSPDKARATVKTVLVADIITTALAVLIVAASARIVSRQLLGGSGFSGLMLLYSGTILLSAPTGVAVGLLRVADRYRWISLLDAGAAIAALIGVAAALLAGTGLAAIISVLLLAAALKSLASLVLATRTAHFLGIAPLRIARVSDLGTSRRDVARFWMSTNGFAALKGFHQNADILIIGRLLGPAPVGLFKVAKSFANLVAFPVAPVYQVTYPELAKLWHSGQQKRALHVARRLTMLTALGVAAFLVVFCALAEYVLIVLAGPGYAPAASALRWLAVGVGISAAAQYQQALLMAAGQVRRMLICFATPVAVQVATLFVMVPRFGIVGGGAALLAFGAVRAAMLTWATEHPTTLPRPLSAHEGAAA